MRRLAVILLLGAAGTAGAVGQWTPVAKTAEVSRQDGAAHWKVWTESFTRERCAPPGSPFQEGTENDHFNCLSHAVLIRNESATPLQCSFTLDLTAPNHEGRARVLMMHDVVFPDGQGRISSVGSTTSLIKSYTTACVAVPAEPAPLTVAPGCHAQVNATYIEDHYPKAAVRALLEGTARVEYSTVPGRNWARDVKLVRSSGVESLDDAALRFMKATRVTSNCPGQLFRYDVEFKLTRFLIDAYGPRKPQVLH